MYGKKLAKNVARNAENILGILSLRKSWYLRLQNVLNDPIKATRIADGIIGEKNMHVMIKVM